jgi:hypothetical protein
MVPKADTMSESLKLYTLLHLRGAYRKHSCTTAWNQARRKYKWTLSMGPSDRYDADILHNESKRFAFIPEGGSFIRMCDRRRILTGIEGWASMMRKRQKFQ